MIYSRLCRRVLEPAKEEMMLHAARDRNVTNAQTWKGLDPERNHSKFLITHDGVI